MSYAIEQVEVVASNTHLDGVHHGLTEVLAKGAGAQPSAQQATEVYFQIED